MTEDEVDRRRVATVGSTQRLLALLGLILTAPFSVAAGVAIRLASPGPALFRATRIGRDAVPFTMFKLRTMHVGSTAQGAITGGADPRVFPVGRLVRKAKLDEIPQLINVLRGEMRFVGPRPEAPEIVRGSYLPWMRETLSVPPGIVGPGSLGYFLEEDQIPDDPTAAQEYYVETLLPRKLARDLVFVRNPSLRYQLELVARTLLGIVGLSNLMASRRLHEEREADRILAEVRTRH